jgi:hypothetical protein
MSEPAIPPKTQDADAIHTIASSVSGLGRPAGTFMYASDAKIIEQIIAELDAGKFTGEGRLTRAIKARITDIEPASMDDKSKVKRIRSRVLKAHPHLAT